MKNIYKKFDSLTAFHSYLDTNKTQPAFENSCDSMRESSSFSGTRTYDEAEGLFMFGDKENAGKIERDGIAKMRSQVRLTENRRQLFCSVTGFQAHVPNYIAGVPCAMINARTVQHKQRVLNLVYNISVGGGVAAESMEEVAVKMLSAILKVEASGVRINLYVADISVISKQTIGWLLRIKSSGQHLDVMKTAYPLCNPSMLRRHSFRFTEVTPGVHSSFVNGYGGASSNCDELLKACGLKNAKTLSYYAMTMKDVDGIVKMILG